jgi:thiol-disulfide isomerase/thioredoxin
VIRALLVSAVVPIVLGFGAAQGARAIELRDFDAKSMATLRADHAGRPFIVAFWSIYCEPCRDEMSQWGALKRKHPDLAIVLVATDPPRDRPTLEQFLSRYDLTGVQTWAYADDFEERVRYAVDRGWAGELPRTYLFDADQRVEARSGLADAARIEAWLAARTKRSK